MGWCPNCDEIQDVAADAPCPVCAAVTLDAERLRAPAAAGTVAVGELGPEAPPAAPGAPAAFALKALPRRKLIAGLAVVVVAAGGFGVAKLIGKTKPAAKATAAPEASLKPVEQTSPTLAPVPQPPFGSAMAGTLSLVAEDNIARVDLTTGDVINVPIGEPSAWHKAMSRDGRAFAYRDDPGMLWVVPNLNGATPVALVSDVADYTFAEDGKSMIVHRTEFVSNRVIRSRIERRALDFSRTDLLFETTRSVGGIWWRRGTLLVRMSDGKSTGIYEVTGRTGARLIRNKASVFDVSSDGEKLLVGPEYTAPGLWVVNVASKAAKQVGPKNLLVSDAVFSPDGKSVALTGTTDYEVTEVCGDGEECGTEYIANNSVVYRTDAALKNMKRLFAGIDLGALAWGPADWIMFGNNGTVTATRGDGADRTLSVPWGSSAGSFVYSA